MPTSAMLKSGAIAASTFFKSLADASGTALMRLRRRTLRLSFAVQQPSHFNLPVFDYNEDFYKFAEIFIKTALWAFIRQTSL